MTPKQVILNKLAKKPAPRCGVCNPVSSTIRKNTPLENLKEISAVVKEPGRSS